MRHLSWFTLGTLGILGLFAYGVGPWWGILLLLLTLGLGWAGSLDKRVPAVMLAGAVFGAILFSSFQNFYLKPLEGISQEANSREIFLTSPMEKTGSGTRAEGVLTHQGKPYRVMVYFRGEEDYLPGDRLQGDFKLYEGDWQEHTGARSQAGEAIFLRAFPEGELLSVRPEKTPWWALPGKIRLLTQGEIMAHFTPQAAPFASALLLGDTSYLTFSQSWDLRISGISHLAAVSGLHVAVLCMLLGVLTFRNPWIMALAGIPGLLFFCGITGFSPSVVRACIMMSLLMLSYLLKRKYDPITGLSAAALLILILHPLTVLSVSFQLSCASVLGIFFFFGRIQSALLLRIPETKGFRETLRQFVSGSLAVSLSSLVFVTPLTAFYFGSLSLIAPITNLLVTWLVPPIFWGILLTVTGGLLGLPFMGLLGSLLSALISLVLSVSHFLAGLPLAAVFTESPYILLFLLCTYLLGIYFLRGISGEYSYFLGLSGLILGICLSLSWFLPLSSDITMQVFDVGQGQCILLQSQGRSFLIDCGGDRQESVALHVLDTLYSRGIPRLDGLILTHFDEDHVGASDELLSVMETDAVYVPAGPALPLDPRLKTVSGELQLSFGDSRLTLMGSETQANDNDMGLCVLLESPEYVILCTGDRSLEGERLLLQNHRIPPVDCLIAGHHGAETSTGLELLRATRPETVIISAGKQNPYGHPSPKTLLRLKKFGCEIRRTDLEGTITIRR